MVAWVAWSRAESKDCADMCLKKTSNKMPFGYDALAEKAHLIFGTIRTLFAAVQLEHIEIALRKHRA